MLKWIRALLVGVLASASLPVSADALFESVPDLTAFNNLTGAWCSRCDYREFRAFDKFTLSGTNTVTGFSVSLHALDEYWPASVNFSIWTVNSFNRPGSQIFVQTLEASAFDTTSYSGMINSVYGNVPFGLVIAETDAVAGLVLHSGTYYVSFYNPNRLAVLGYLGGGGDFLQEGASFDDGYELRPGESAGFVLTGRRGSHLPEPDTLALLCLGLAGLAFARRRKH